jgi:hypothetical protein
MAIEGRMIPAGICMPKVTEANKVPTTAARSSKIIVGAVDSFPHRPRILVWSVHSLNKAATNSVDCTLLLAPA